MFFPDEALAILFPVLDDGFGCGFTPWETQPDPTPDQPQTASDRSEPDRATFPAEQRKLRRMISNRESARRSRMRKQRHLEDLRCQVNRLGAENRDLSNRLAAVSQYCLLFRRDNDRLRAESSALRRRLSDIRRLLIFRKLQRLAPTMPAAASGFAPGNLAAVCGGYASGNELNTSSLIV